MAKYKIGYAQGVFDMFHIGHLNLINHAKEQCDYLIVAVNSDELTYNYKKKKPVINENDRVTIVSNIKAVDEGVIADTLDKVEAWNKYHFDAIFIGDDWKGSERWKQTEVDLAPLGAKVEYLHYTENVSSTMLKTVKDERIHEK